MAINSYLMPPIQTNFEGDIRKAGFELEFTNIKIDTILQILQSHCKLKVQKINKYYYKLSSQYGDFTLELDFELLTKQNLQKSANKLYDTIGLTVDKKIVTQIEDIIGNLSEDIVPYEIGTPPLPINELKIVDNIVEQLSLNNAHGTKNKIYYAFGLHINIELISLDAKSILSYLQAYMVLQDYLKKDANLDIARKISPFIDDFKSDYIAHILNKDYNPDINTLIEDYIKFNPTRNRSLDMLPVFTYINEKLVRSYLPDEKIKPRPTFHYRLSNSMIGDTNWNVANEWNRWIIVERLANNQESLEKLCDKYLEYIDSFINLTKWEDEVKKWL